MLNTINGFDLLLVIMIVALVFKAMRLNDECNSYVRQIVEVSQQNVLLTREIVQWEAKYEYDSDLAEPAWIPASHDHHPENHEYLSYCDCNKCIPF
jgi:hypothetical protein